MNAWAVSDHVIAHGLPPGSPSDVYCPEQLIFVGRTDDSLAPIRGLGLNQSKRRHQSERWKRLDSDESQRRKPPRRVVERRYIGNTLLGNITKFCENFSSTPRYNRTAFYSVRLNP